ncbi:hypothetical protein [Pseudomonas sp. UFMG81]|uniref:hypothetical protein n=1 Tax=Pseudomonas sp. UFMG81 TaxID=2745936 RepID=UPI00188EE760|nr:hypothetical protein [Pseudomonas sp. UFMG81]
MHVYIEKNTEQNRWWVCMDDWRAGFNTCAEAEAFVERLATRINAPHSLDMLADGAPRAGLSGKGMASASVPAQADLPCAKEA